MFTGDRSLTRLQLDCRYLCCTKKRDDPTVLYYVESARIVVY